MFEAGQDVLQILLHGLGAARQIDDEGLAAQDAGGAAEHPARGDAQAVIPHGLGDAGGAAGGHGIGGLRGDIARGEAGAAGGQDQVHLSAIGQPDELGLQRLGLIGQDHGLLHLVPGGGQHLHDERAALVLPLAAGAFVRQGDDGCAQRRVFFRGQQDHLVAHMESAAVEHTGEHALVGHDALAGLLFDDAVVVAFLADLGHLQHDLTDLKAAGDGQIAEIEPLHNEVFAKGTVIDPDLLAEVLDLFGAEQADLTVPVSAVGVGLNAPFRGQGGFGHLGLDGAALRAGANGQDLSHIILRSDTSRV